MSLIINDKPSLDADADEVMEWVGKMLQELEDEFKNYGVAMVSGCEVNDLMGDATRFVVSWSGGVSLAVGMATRCVNRMLKEHNGDK